MAENVAPGPCPRCGAELYQRGSKRFKCEACGYSWSAYDLERARARNARDQYVKSDPLTHAATLDLAHNRARQQLLKGFVVLLIGSIVTGITYLRASAGGTYIVARGAIVFGALQFLIGLYNFFQTRAAINKFVNEIHGSIR